MLTLAALPDWAIILLVVLFLFVALALLLIVLVQKPQGGGLSGAFGATSGSGATAFGVKTGDALTVTTVVIFVLFVGTAVGLNFAMNPSPSDALAQPLVPEGDDAGVSEDGEASESDGGDVTPIMIPVDPSQIPAQILSEDPTETPTEDPAETPAETPETTGEPQAETPETPEDG